MTPRRRRLRKQQDKTGILKREKRECHRRQGLGKIAKGSSDENEEFKFNTKATGASQGSE